MASFSSFESFIRIRTDDVVHSTDCQARWGNVIVILSYIYKSDLILIWEEALPQLELQIFWSFTIVWNIWDNVSAHLDKIDNKIVIVF